MTVQRIIKVGSSIAVIIPAEVARTFKWRRGDYLVVAVPYDRTLIMYKPSPRVLRALPGVSPRRKKVKNNVGTNTAN